MTESRHKTRICTVKDKITEYRKVLKLPTTPLRVKVVIVLTLAYLLCPIDIIPDFIPVLGQLDDILIVGVAAAYIARTLNKTARPEPWPSAE